MTTETPVVVTPRLPNREKIRADTWLVIHRAADIFPEGSAQAILWFYKPMALVLGKTPDELVKLGKTKGLMDYLASVEAKKLPIP